MTAPRDRDRISPAVAVRPIVAVDAQHQWSQQLSFQDACGGREAVKRPPGRRRRQHRRRVHAAKLALARRRLRVAGGGRSVPIAWRSTRRREVRESQRAERNNEGQVFKWQPPRLSERAVNAVVALTYQALGVAEIVGDIDDLQPVDKAEGGRLAALDAEGDEGRRRSSSGERRTPPADGWRGRAIVDRADLRMRLEEGGALYGASCAGRAVDPRAKPALPGQAVAIAWSRSRRRKGFDNVTRSR
jgi:hypothetical protein